MFFMHITFPLSVHNVCIYIFYLERSPIQNIQCWHHARIKVVWDYSRTADRVENLRSTIRPKVNIKRTEKDIYNKGKRKR